MGTLLGLATAVQFSLPLVLYAVYSTVEWYCAMKKCLASRLRRFLEMGCTESYVKLFLALFVLNRLLINLALFGLPALLFGERGLIVSAIAFFLLDLPGFLEVAREDPPFLPLRLAYRALGACALALLWRFNPLAFVSVTVTNDLLLSLVARRLASKNV